MPKTSRNECASSTEEPPPKRRKSSESEEEEEDSATNTDTDDEVGFTLKLADNEVIRVSKKDSEQLQESCAFFRNAFRHGTLECQHQIISKPDWTVDTASAILELLQKKTLSVPQNYALLKEAADQILLPIRVLHPINGSNIQEDGELVQSMADTWTAATTTFSLDMEAWVQARPRRDRHHQRHAIWDNLLQAGTVFVDHQHHNQDDGLNIQVVPENNNNNNAAPDASRAKLLSVGSFAPLTVAVNHTCLRLSEALRDQRPERSNFNRPICMALPLYCGAKQLLEKQFPEKEFLTIETNNVPTVNMTRVTGKEDDLRSVLTAAIDYIAPVNLSKLCYLLIPEPDIQVLGKLITACQGCQDDPATVGWDLQKNQYCTLKTLRDTETILDTLLDPTTKSANSGTIRLVNVDMGAAPTWAPY